MRMSCNGCRILRKGCNDNCSIKPCLQWIKTPESQANATVFLAKFYGRAGLMNLINAAPEHHRPAVFRSLLYEGCGRIVNPIHGSAGLLWSGNWQLCQDAVEAVLRGAPITQIATDAAVTHNGPPLKAYDIRHVSKDEKLAGSNDLHRVRTRCRFKKTAAKPKSNPVWVGFGDESGHDEFHHSSSHDSSLSHQSVAAPHVETESLLSVEMAEPPVVVPEIVSKEADDHELELELTLGFGTAPLSRSGGVASDKTFRRCEAGNSTEGGECKLRLGF